MLADFGEVSCSLLLAILVKQSGGEKLIYNRMLAICNLLVEYGHCIVEQT